jgi:hypothetical protein
MSSASCGPVHRPARKPVRRPSQHRLDAAGELPPVVLLGGQGGDSLIGQPVDPAAPPSGLRPGADQKAGVLQAVQGRVDGSLREIERSRAAVTQRRDDRVPVRWPGGQDRQQQQIKVALEPLTVHTQEPYA